MTTTAPLDPIEAIAAHSAPVNHIAFAEGGRLMATADTEMRAKVWRGRECFLELDMRSISDKVRPTERVRGIRFSADAERIIVAAGENVAAFGVASANPEPIWTYVAPRLFAFLIISPTSIAVSERNTLAAAFDNGTIAIWDSLGNRTALIRHNASPRQLTFIPDERIIGTDGFSVSLWRPDERKPLWHRPSRERIYGLAASSNGEYVAVRRLYSTTVYEIDSGEKVVEHKQGRGLPLLAFAPDTNVLAIGTQHAINLYDVKSGAHGRLALEEAELISLTFLPDGSPVVAGCSDGRIRVWENPLFRSQALKV
jgi:WD40 repeat protein